MGPGAVGVAFGLAPTSTKKVISVKLTRNRYIWIWILYIATTINLLMFVNHTSMYYLAKVLFCIVESYQVF